MSRAWTDDQLADKLEQHQVDRVVLDEAAKRIRQAGLRTLIHTNDIIEAIQQSPLLDHGRQRAIVEQIVSAVKPRRQSSARMSSIAAKVLADPDATPRERSLAASVLSQDETPDQS